MGLITSRKGAVSETSVNICSSECILFKTNTNIVKLCNICDMRVVFLVLRPKLQKHTEMRYIV